MAELTAQSATVMSHLVIAAGGRGLRLARLSGDVPKALVHVGGKPVLAHQLELAAAAGIRDVTIFAGYLGSQIEAFVGDGSRYGVNARIYVEDEPLGSAGALLRSLDALPEQFLLVFGDVMLAVDLQRMAQNHIARRADLTALAHPNDHPHDLDLLEADGDGWVTAVHAYPHPPEKFFGNLVNAALYVVRREALRACAGAPRRQQSDKQELNKASNKKEFTKDVLCRLVETGARVLVYRSSEYIKDMGTPERLCGVEADWQAGRIRPEASSPCRPAVFLDRDGTLNIERGSVRTPKDLQLLPGVGAALRMLRQEGYRLIVLTNQSVIARGEACEADVASIHRRLEWELGKEGAYLDGIYLCPHHPHGGFPGERIDLKMKCECRKPATGLFERACAELRIDRARSWMIGDQTRDIEMARRAGVRSVLVQTGYAGSDGKFDAVPDFVACDLAAAAGFILRPVDVAVP